VRFRRRLERRRVWPLLAAAAGVTVLLAGVFMQVRPAREAGRFEMSKAESDVAAPQGVEPAPRVSSATLDEDTAPTDGLAGGNALSAGAPTPGRSGLEALRSAPAPGEESLDDRVRGFAARPAPEPEPAPPGAEMRERENAPREGGEGEREERLMDAVPAPPPAPRVAMPEPPVQTEAPSPPPAPPAAMPESPAKALSPRKEEAESAPDADEVSTMEIARADEEQLEALGYLGRGADGQSRGIVAREAPPWRDVPESKSKVTERPPGNRVLSYAPAPAEKQRATDSRTEAGIPLGRRIADRSFYFKDGAWLQLGYEGEETESLKRGSDAFDRLAEAHPELRALAEVAERVVFRVDGKWFDVPAREEAE